MCCPCLNSQSGVFSAAATRSETQSFKQTSVLAMELQNTFLGCKKDSHSGLADLPARGPHIPDVGTCSRSCDIQQLAIRRSSLHRSGP